MNAEEAKSTNNTSKGASWSQVLVMILTVVLLVGHAAKFEALRVDATTLTLVCLLVVIPLAELIRKVKVGDFFEAEIGKREVAEVEAKAAIELSPATETSGQTKEERIRLLLDEDPRLALAKVRIELEESLRRLFLGVGHEEHQLRRWSVGRIIDDLSNRHVLRESVAVAIRDVMALANRAIHGERVEREAAEQLALLGTRLIGELQSIHTDTAVSSEVISNEEADEFQSSRYRVVTVVPYVENPVKKTYVLSQSALDDLLEGYGEYAEFVVSVERL